MGSTTAQAAAWGIAREYRDASGRLRRTPAATRQALLEAMGAAGGEPPAPAAVVVVRQGETRPLARPVEIQTEDGREIRALDSIPAGLPAGYHRMVERGGAEARLIVTPWSCHLPRGLRTWGWAAQLYAARSRSSWGIGDLADLRELARWSRHDLGAGMLLLNPLHAALPGLPQQPSPYYASSRRFRNPLYIRVDEVPGAGRLGTRLQPLIEAGRALNALREIDRDAAYRLKMEALEAIWKRVADSDDPAFSRYRATQGTELEAYATFCALSERYGRPWRSWPAAYRHPGAAAVARFRQRHHRRVNFHQWLQWLLDLQLENAARELKLIGDLAIGTAPDGADAWLWQDQLAQGVEVGAPPDPLNTQGQDWGLPPFDPWKLREAGYEPFIQTLRASLRHCGGLRVDHVMGLFRLFWIPAGAGAADGAYVRYPASDLLGILALESRRAGAYVVGEDLGTVQRSMRAQLRRRRVLSYRLLWFEREPTSSYPRRALAAVTTHDLPTVAGVWSGSDLTAQLRLGMVPDQGSMEWMRRRLEELAGDPDGSQDPGIDAVVAAAYAALAQAPSSLLAATLDDALSVEERPNMPGTTTEWPNWSQALPASLEELMADPRAVGIAAALRRQG